MLWVGVMACRGPSDEAATEVFSISRVEGAVVGCTDVGPDRACVFEPGTPLTVWADLEPDAQPKLSAGGARLDAVAVDVPDGVRWTVTPEASWRSLEAEGTTGQVSFALLPAAAPSAVLANVYALRDAGELEQALATLNHVLPTLAHPERVEAQELEGDLAFLRGDVQGAVEAYGRGARLAAGEGKARKASTMAQRIVYACTALEPDEACVQAWLDFDAGWVASDPEQSLLHDYYRALFSAQIRDRRAAERGFTSVIERAHALGLLAVRVSALVEVMLLAAEVGDWAAVARHRAQAEAVDLSLSTSMRAQIHNAVGWMLLLAHARGRDDLPSPTSALERALALASGDDAVSLRLRTTLKLNLAYDALLDDDLDRALRWLTSFEQDSPLHADERMWAALLRARVEASRGKLEAARRTFAEVAREAPQLGEPELAWHAHVGMAEVFARQGRTAEAVSRHEEAAGILERELPKIALGAGRAHYLAERSQSTQRHVRLLLDADRVDDALCVVRRARSRSLRVVARSIRAGHDAARSLREYREGRARLERDLEAAWMLPTDRAEARLVELRAARLELRRTLDREVFAGSSAPVRTCETFPSPSPGQVSLYYTELDEGWVGFAATAGTTTIRRLGARPGSTSPQALATWLVQPFADVLADATSLRIVASSSVHTVRFSQLPDPSFPDRRLGQRLAVVYGLDVPTGSISRAEPAPALVIVPPSNLDAAVAERDAVVAALGGSADRVRILDGDDASGAAVRRALSETDLAHFVGHATYAGKGWGGGLQLARGDVFEVEDVFALRRVPRVLVLAGCETGRADELSMAGGMSLAHAFVLAGASTVVAAEERVADVATAAMARPFYEALRSGNSAARALELARAAVATDGLEPPPLRVWVH